MPDQEAIRRGRKFEQAIADSLSLSMQPGSGNKFYAKNDCQGRGLSVSCKSQNVFKWVEIKQFLKDSIDDAFGTGSIGILALEDLQGEKGYFDNIPTEQYVVMTLSDFSKAFQEEIKIPDHSESKGIEKRKTAEIPLMLR